jgi:hypothetical protein
MLCVTRRCTKCRYRFVGGFRKSNHESFGGNIEPTLQFQDLLDREVLGGGWL